MFGGVVGGAAGKLKGKVEAGNWLWRLVEKDGRPARLLRAARWWRGATATSRDVAVVEQGSMVGFVVVEENVVALWVKVHIVFQCCAR